MKDKTSHLSGKISLCLKLLKEGGQEEGGEEEDDGPKENIWDVGPMMTTGSTHKLPMEFLAHLKKTALGEYCDMN